MTSNKCRVTSKANNSHCQREAVAAVAVLGAQTAAEYPTTYLIKEPMYNSILTGAVWVQELLNGHVTRFYKALGMVKPMFSWLCHELEVCCGLQNSKFLGLEEKVMIFL